MPLAALPVKVVDRVLHVEDLDQARQVLAHLYGKVTADLRPRTANQFAWQVRPTSIGCGTVICGDIQTEMIVQTAEMARYVFGTVRRGHYDVRCRDGAFHASAGEVGFMASPGSDLSVRASAGTQTFNLTIEASALASHLAALTGAPHDQLPRFTPLADLRHGPGADIMKLADLLREASERPDGLLASPYVLGHLREALYSALLLGIDHTASHLLQSAPPRTDHRLVKHVEEYLRSNASEPVSIAALARHLGIGIRALERSFKAIHDCSIRTFLKALRLELAHRRLAAGEPSTTVTQILHASGFGHAGTSPRPTACASASAPPRRSSARGAAAPDAPLRRAARARAGGWCPGPAAAPPSRERARRLAPPRRQAVRR